MNNTPRRVGGFLLFYCIYLTVMVPIAGIAAHVLIYNEARPAFEIFPGLFRLILWSAALNLIMIAASAFAGYRLWTLQPHAVQTAKIFHVIAFLIIIVTTFLSLTAGLPADVSATFEAEAPIDVLKGLTTMVFWISYLRKSDRVRETYSPSAAEPVIAT